MCRSIVHTFIPTALALIVRSPHAQSQLAADQKANEQTIQALMFARLNDDDIDVRKVTATFMLQLFLQIVA